MKNAFEYETELAGLQATIARLTAEIERLSRIEHQSREALQVANQNTKQVIAERDSLAERLKGGKGEPLKIGSGVTLENVGFSSHNCDKTYLRFDIDGNLAEVNLINVALVSKLGMHTPAQLAAVGVHVEDAPASVVLPGRAEFEEIAKSECLERVGRFVPARASDGGYKNVTTDMLWNCFKAFVDKVKELNQ